MCLFGTSTNSSFDEEYLYGGFIMKHLKILSMTTLFTSMTFAGPYLELSAGGSFAKTEGDQLSYENRKSLMTEVSLGHQWQAWDLSLDGSYSIGRQKNFIIPYDNNQIQDDFNVHRFNIGPTIKYHIKGDDSNWSWAPFLGLYVNHTNVENSSELSGENIVKDKDNSHELFGYGAKLGVVFKQYTPESKYIESINYRIFSSYTDYSDVEGSYVSGSEVKEYDGNIFDSLKDYSVGFSIGVSFGDKIIRKGKEALNL